VLLHWTITPFCHWFTVQSWRFQKVANFVFTNPTLDW
jgi:hypothetical protein